MNIGKREFAFRYIFNQFKVCLLEFFIPEILEL
jgi:hypothetical protein